MLAAGLILAMAALPQSASPDQAEAPSAQGAPAGDVLLARMTALYDDLCVKAFPDDAAVDAAMAAKGATKLKKKEVAIYLHDDPGRGWSLPDGDAEIIVTVEAPPYHACGVRRQMDAPFADLTPYRAVADAYELTKTGFQPIQPADFDVNGVHSHVEGEQSISPDGSGDSLFVFTNTPGVAKPVEVRFVHQLAAPGAK